MIIVMGVAGSGKTTVGQKLALALNCPFYEGDDFHPPSNVEKMKKGISLTDEDRDPWLKLLSDKMGQWKKDNPVFVLACSALKAKYRRVLETHGKVTWIYLKGSYEMVSQRLSKREGHYFPAQLLQSQFQDLEEPEKALVMDIALSEDKIVSVIRNQMRLEK
jgi:carbohydrate kinase (thermoresistant glucokinase family)